MKNLTNHIKKRIAVIFSMTLFLALASVFTAMAQNMGSAHVLYPGRRLPADLTVSIGSSADPSAVYYVVTYPVAEVMTVGSDGNPAPAEKTQLIRPDAINSAWIELPDYSVSDTDSVTVIYGLSDIVSPGNSSTLLDTLIYADVIESQLTDDIQVRSAVYTVPASLTGRSSGRYTKSELEKIYRDHVRDSASAALSESETAFTPGNCDISITEDGSIPEVIPSGSEYRISDVIRIANTGNLPCMVRTAIDFDSYKSEAASAITGMDGSWSYDDGFYYYDKVLEPGEVSDVLMTGIDISALSPEDAADYKVGIYAEAVNAIDESNAPPHVRDGQDPAADDSKVTNSSSLTHSSGSSPHSSDTPLYGDVIETDTPPEPVSDLTPDIASPDLPHSPDNMKTNTAYFSSPEDISGPHYLVISLRQHSADISPAEAYADNSPSVNNISFMTVLPWVLVLILLILCIIGFTKRKNIESEGKGRLQRCQLFREADGYFVHVLWMQSDT